MGAAGFEPEIVPEYAGRSGSRKTVPPQFFVATCSAVIGLLWLFLAGSAGVGIRVHLIGLLACPTLSVVSVTWGIVRLLAWPKHYDGWVVATLAAILTVGVTLLSALAVWI